MADRFIDFSVLNAYQDKMVQTERRKQTYGLLECLKHNTPMNKVLTPTLKQHLQTVEGRTTYYVRISDNPDVDEPNEPETLYTGMTHSREVSSLMNLMYYMWYVLENYDTDPAIKSLVDNTQGWIAIDIQGFIRDFNEDGTIKREPTPDLITNIHKIINYCGNRLILKGSGNEIKYINKLIVKCKQR